MVVVIGMFYTKKIPILLIFSNTFDKVQGFDKSFSKLEKNYYSNPPEQKYQKKKSNLANEILSEFGKTSVEN